MIRRFSLDQLASALTGIAIALIVSLSALALIVSMLNGQAIREFQEEHKRETTARQVATIEAVERLEAFIHAELVAQDEAVRRRLYQLLQDIKAIRFSIREIDGRTIIQPIRIQPGSADRDPSKGQARQNRKDKR